eukprot:TRINITY_DN3974_c1_g2_i1.p1 TRINITY_DN3974_c1_g2~~TRINITY_DN3974_c1_g2_i1.p1  ORF type:complete len:116 (+),score=26.72 TRINITY_DN3974_c1_g2_i1:362-709(+)
MSSFQESHCQRLLQQQQRLLSEKGKGRVTHRMRMTGVKTNEMGMKRQQEQTKSTRTRTKGTTGTPGTTGTTATAAPAATTRRTATTTAATTAIIILIAKGVAHAQLFIFAPGLNN